MSWYFLLLPSLITPKSLFCRVLCNCSKCCMLDWLYDSLPFILATVLLIVLHISIGEIVCFHVHIPACQNIYPPDCLLQERGSMIYGGHLFSQSTLIIAWHQTIDLQSCFIFNSCFQWNKLLNFWMSHCYGWWLSCFPGWQLLPLPLKCSIFKVTAVGTEGGNTNQDWYIIHQCHSCAYAQSALAKPTLCLPSLFGELEVVVILYVQY